MSTKELNQIPTSYRPKGGTSTPYDKAQQVWDDREGAIVARCASWRLAALISSCAVLVLAVALAYVASRTSVIPYVIEVGTNGAVRPIGPVGQPNYIPSRAVLEYFLSQFVVNTRSVPIDPIVARSQWLTAYAYLSPEATNTLNEIARREKPLEKIGSETTSVQVRNVVPLSPSSYQVRWEETSYDKNGTSTAGRKMTGLFTVKVQPPSDEKISRVNPLGLYIQRFSWSQDMF